MNRRSETTVREPPFGDLGAHRREADAFQAGLKFAGTWPMEGLEVIRVPAGGKDGPVAASGRVGSLRRSQRVCLNVEVEVEVRRGKEKPTTEHTKTLIVSAHGALILLRTSIAVRDALKLRHGTTKEEMDCRVVDVNASTSGAPEVGIEFLRPQQNFWRIAFPPLDWNPRGAESKVQGPQVMAGAQRPQKP